MTKLEFLLSEDLPCETTLACVEIGEGTCELRFDAPDLTELHEGTLADMKVNDGSGRLLWGVGQVRAGKPRVKKLPASKWQEFKLLMMPRWFRRLFPVQWMWEITYPFTVCEKETS